MSIPMASGLRNVFSTKLPTIPMGIPMSYSYGCSYGQWPKEGVFLKDTSCSYGYSYRAIPMGIPMGIPMASGPGRVFPSKLPAMTMGIPMELFLWVFVAQGGCFP